MTIEDRVTALEGTLGTLIANLLEPALIGAQLEFGNGVSRLDGLAIQVRSQGGEENAGYGIVFVPNFVTGTGEFNALAAKAILESTLDEPNKDAILALRPIATGATGRSELSLSADTASESIELNMVANEAASIGHAVFSGGPVRLPTAAGGFTMAADGDLDYDTTSDKARLRANGATVNLATEGYVDAAAGPSWGSGAELTIATGAITVGDDRWYLVDTEGDAGSDDLVTISGGTAGQPLVLTAASSARTVVVKHGTGNIYLDGGADFSLDHGYDSITLLKIGSEWIEISKADNA